MGKTAYWAALAVFLGLFLVLGLATMNTLEIMLGPDISICDSGSGTTLDFWKWVRGFDYDWMWWQRSHGNW